MNQRLLSKAEAAAYCGMSSSGFSDWQRRGLVPGPLSGTRKWDAEAIKLALDKASGLAPVSSPTNEYEAWRSQRRARQA